MCSRKWMTIIARPASGEEHLELARNAVRIALIQPMNYVVRKALLLPLELGLNLSRRQLLLVAQKGRPAPVAERDLRNQANLSLEEEKVMLQEVFDSADVGGGSAPVPV
ncbi:MAG: hypothetical protein Q7U93_13425 [Nitrosomonas sp.]|jgi:hypothetical protein|nr:hypothetical protein [Nitrosomonas sp.]